MAIDCTKLPFHWTGDAWILPDEERRANTLDDYWDEPPRPELPADPRYLITFQGADAWRWDALRQGYVMLIRHGRVTIDGRELLALSPAYCT